MKIYSTIINTDNEDYTLQSRNISIFPLLVCIGNSFIDIIYYLILGYKNILKNILKNIFKNITENYKAILDLKGYETPVEVKDLKKEKLLKGKIIKSNPSTVILFT